MFLFYVIILFGLALRWYGQRSDFYWVASLPGTVLHESLHWIAGWAVNAGPGNFCVWPKTQPDGRKHLGSVTFTNLNVLSVIPVVFAPLMAWPMVYWVSSWIHFSSTLALTAYILIGASVISQAWPSRGDMQLLYYIYH